MADAAPQQEQEEIPYISFSALSDFIRCGKYWQLKRLLKLPERPAYWNAGGRAVHQATEAYDRALFTERGR